MAKKHFQRALSVGLSLALCASMVAPGFAATFGQLQDAIDGGDGDTESNFWFTDGDGFNHYGYGNKKDDGWEIEAWNGKKLDENGEKTDEDTRYVTLYEDVGHTQAPPSGSPSGAPSGSPAVSSDPEGGIVVKRYQDVTLDLNGHDINLNPDWTYDLTDADPKETKFGTMVNRNNPGLKVEIGSGTAQDALDDAGINSGSVITVREEGVLTLKDGSKDAANGQPGKITGGASYCRFGEGENGAGVENYGTFTMEGGEMSGNWGWTAGGVNNEYGGTFTMKDGIITGNAGGLTGDTNNANLLGGEISGNIFFDLTYYANTIDLRQIKTKIGRTYVSASNEITFRSGETAGKWRGILVTDKDGNEYMVALPVNVNESIEMRANQTIPLPAGSTVIKTGKEGNTTEETTYLSKVTIDKDGKIIGESATVTKDKETGDVTIDDGKGGRTEVTVPDDKNGEVKPDGSTHIPGGSEQPVEVKKDGEDEGTKITAPEGSEIVVKPDGSADVPAGGKVIGKDEDGNPTETELSNGGTVNPDGTTTVPAGSTVTDKDGNVYELPEGGKITADGTVVDENGNPVAPKKGNTNAGGGTGGTGGTDVVVIDGVEVPLAGLVSVDDVLGVLYRLAEGVDGEHDDVIAWAVENGIIDDETDVEELVTVAALRAILANYARAFELDVDVNTLATLTGEDDDIVMNCDEVIDEFFAKSKEDEAA